jgi:hypothetical protein
VASRIDCADNPMEKTNNNDKNINFFIV